jgi:hypothetical protein
MLNQLESFLNDELAANDLSAAIGVNSGMREEFATDLSERLPGSQVVYTEDFVDWIVMSTLVGTLGFRIKENTMTLNVWKG